MHRTVREYHEPRTMFNPIMEHLMSNSFRFFWPRLVAYGILVSQPEIQPRPLAVKAPRTNHWTARDFPPIS